MFRVYAALALALHAGLLLSSDGLRAGGDMVPHLGLIEWMQEEPGLRNIYSPAYHVLGALLAPWVGLASYPKLFAFASAAALIFAFRVFQRAAALPETSAALFALSPYALTLSWCLPKVEFMGLAIGLLGLAALAKRRLVWVAVAVTAAFLVHTGAALTFGLAAGVFALARRDRGALLALAAGTLAAAPLPAWHVAAGCTLAEALLFSSSGYLSRAGAGDTDALLLFGLASPIVLVVAAAGFGPLWRRERSLALVAGALVALYLNPLWLAPWGQQTAAGFYRGLSVLAIPLAMLAGAALEGRDRRLRLAVIGACALYAAVAAAILVPRSCFVRPISLAELHGLEVRRCEFAWRGQKGGRRGGSRPPRLGVAPPGVPAPRAPAQPPPAPAERGATTR